ncbi:DUF4252 domain-containing protein [Flavobacterium jejuense]|uniref:DUF4252 domain-containing protein n=1 Tax=Flavobacterium jejuense TaxID=1544455 RepID=A0ABX0IWB3_9FLAO|nr:DUF4252 domain-containing protein [Flavobacterium jejuense]NHN27753.1 DUF4252 domain-containing protein [Flavobacterium jejuense]
MKSYIVIILSFFLFSCSNEPSLQKYFVDNSESPDFIALDLGSSIINTEKMTLSKEDKEVLKSFEKMNIIAFKKDSLNEEKYTLESKKVKEILKSEKYQELMRMGSGNNGGAIYFVGEEEHIDEFVLFATGKENGFAVVRILGNDMNPSQIMSLVSLMQKANLNLEQLKPLKSFMN